MILQTELRLPLRIPPEELMRRERPRRHPWWLKNSRMALEGTNVKNHIEDLFAGLSGENLRNLFSNLPPIYLQPVAGAIEKAAIIQNKLLAQGVVPGETEPKTQEQRLLAYLLIVAIATVLIFLAGCSAPPAVGSTGAQETNQAATAMVTGMPTEMQIPVSEPEPIAEPTLSISNEVAEVAPPAVVELPTAVPTEVSPPTPEVAPIPPEIPFRVENKVVQKWTVNPVTNQEEWVPDDTFPVIKHPNRSASVIDKIISVTYQINGEEVRYFGAISAIYGDTEAIFINGEWTLATEINAKDFIAPVGPGEVKFANENWSDGHNLIESGSMEFLEKFRQAWIDGNPDYFRWYVGGSDISLNNVLAVAATRNYMLPVPPDGVPKLLPPSWDQTRYSTEFARRTRNSHTEISVDINFGGLAILIFTPDQIKNDPILDTIVSGLPKTHLLTIYISERGQYGIVILPDGSLVWVHGEQVGPSQNTTTQFKTTLLGEHPENFSGIALAHADAYLSAMRIEEGESVRVFPLDPYRYEEPGMISGDEVGLSPFVE